MKIKYSDFQNECMNRGGAMFHWNLEIAVKAVTPDKEWKIGVVNMEDSEEMTETIFKGTPADCLLEILGLAYKCAIATRNGGNFHYKSGMVPFDQWVAMEWKSVDGGVYLPDPDIVWAAYREARGKTTQKA